MNERLRKDYQKILNKNKAIKEPISLLYNRIPANIMQFLEEGYYLSVLGLNGYKPRIGVVMADMEEAPEKSEEILTLIEDFFMEEFNTREYTLDFWHEGDIPVLLPINYKEHKKKIFKIYIEANSDLFRNRLSSEENAKKAYDNKYFLTQINLCAMPLWVKADTEDLFYEEKEIIVRRLSQLLNKSKIEIKGLERLVSKVNEKPVITILYKNSTKWELVPFYLLKKIKASNYKELIKLLHRPEDIIQPQ